MPDIYEQAQAFRAALLRRDDAALAAITEVYGQAYSRLLRQISALANAIEERRRQGLDVSPAWLRKLDRYQALLRDIDVEFRRFSAQAGALVTARRRVEIERGIRDATNLIQTGAGQVSVQFDRLAPPAVENITAAFASDSPLTALFNEIAPLASTEAQKTLTNAVVQGWNPRKTAVEMRRALGIPLNRAMLISRTETIRAYREATRATYEANDDVVTGWIWTSSRSLRTCLNCLSRDGTFYPLTKPLPGHPACRCSVRPAIKGIPDTTPPASEWFASLSPDQQRLMMGKRAHELYSSGDISLEDFRGVRRSAKWGESTYQRSLREILGE